MSDQFEPDELVISTRGSDWLCTYKGEEINPWTKGVVGGRGEFFNIHDEFFIKTTWAYRSSSQCKTEAFQYAKIEAKDLCYFSTMLGCSDFNRSIHWTAWRWIPKLVKHWSDHHAYERCAEIVSDLCDKYRIGDVTTYPNGNWWIVKNQPLIVDLGCSLDDGGSS